MGRMPWELRPSISTAQTNCKTLLLRCALYAFWASELAGPIHSCILVLSERFCNCTYLKRSCYALASVTFSSGVRQRHYWRRNQLLLKFVCLFKHFLVQNESPRLVIFKSSIFCRRNPHEVFHGPSEQFTGAKKPYYFGSILCRAQCFNGIRLFPYSLWVPFTNELNRLINCSDISLCTG